MKYSILLFLLTFLEFGCTEHANYTNRLRTSFTKANSDIDLNNLNFDFSDGIHISGYISYSDKEKCLIETTDHKIGLQCRVSTWIMKSSSFSLSKPVEDLNCSNNDINIVYQNIFACYYGCAIINVDNGEVYEFETVDLLNERYKIPMWVIYGGIAVGILLIAICFICACCCCLKCCCPCLLCC